MGTDEMTARQMVESALFAPSSWFVNAGNGLWNYRDEIRDSFQSGVLSAALHYLELRRAPVNHREMIKHVSKITGFPKVSVQSKLYGILFSDLRFSNLSEFWMLSKWQLINNLVYEYLRDRNILVTSVKEVERTVRAIYKEVSTNAIFAPAIDKRFLLESDGTLKVIQNVAVVDVEKEMVIPNALINEVERHVPKIVEFIKNLAGEAVHNSTLLNKFFLITREQTSYSIYEKVLSSILKNQISIVRVREDEWKWKLYSSTSMSEDFHVPHVFGSSVDLPIEILTSSENNDILHISRRDKEHNSNLILERTAVQRETFIVLYTHRISGEITPSSRLKNLMGIDCEIASVRIIAHTYEGFIFEWEYNPDTNKLTGMEDYFIDYDIEPGTNLAFMKRSESLSVDVWVVGVNEDIAREQKRFDDIEQLTNQAEISGKSYFAIMCEIMASYLSEGIHYRDLTRIVSEVREASSSSIQGVLSKYDCFVQKEQRSGVWFLVPSKIKNIDAGIFFASTTQDLQLKRDDNTILLCE
ncbi:MAG: hypothetical protein ACXVNF_01700, partial [Neobacillus sp.]